MGKFRLIVGVAGVGIFNEGGNKFGTPIALNCGTGTDTLGASTGSLDTSFGLIEASTFNVDNGSCLGEVLEIPYPLFDNPNLAFEDAEYGFVEVGNSLYFELKSEVYLSNASSLLWNTP